MLHNEKTAPARAASSNAYAPNNKYGVDFQAFNQQVQETAKALAREGIQVFPVLSNKAPACPNGYKAASKDPDIVAALWQKHPAPLIGVPTGAISGIDALDIDPRHGGNKWLADHAAKIPTTRLHQTRSGGWHYFFRHHAGLRNSAGRVAKGVDVRADGGYIIWWAGAGFPVLNDVPVASWADWLLALALPPPLPPRSFVPPQKLPVVRRFQDSKQAAYARAALRRAFQAVLTAAEGTRTIP